MNCKHCNQPISEDSKFCPYCGNQVDKTTNIKVHRKNLSNLFNKIATLKMLLLLLVIGVWILVFQNLGVIPVTQNVNVKEVEYGTEIGIRGAVDANLQYINGRRDVFFNNPSRGEEDKYYVIPVSVE